jgi:predicted nucleotide-binding protein
MAYHRLMAERKATKTPPQVATITATKALTRLRRLYEQLTDLKSEGHNSTLATAWPREVEGVLSDFYGSSSLKFQQFHRIHFSPSVYYSGQPESAFTNAFTAGVNSAQAYLQSRIAELEEDLADSQNGGEIIAINAAQLDRHKVFVVHGHDDGMKETIARYISKLGLDPVILHEQPNEGRTIIEKFEHHAEVGCAVVLLTADDTGSSKTAPTKTEARARQNVVFEMGFFVGKLGRKHTIALLQPGVCKPSDIDGVVYIPMNDESWKLLLVRELKAAGMQIDANRAFA